jgi:hypothetical protein
MSETRWLFDSQGRPVAFVDQGAHVFTADGRFFGRIEADAEVWHLRYRGEIVDDDRLLFDPDKHRGIVRPHGGTPARPLFVTPPPPQAAVSLPHRLRDVVLP